MPVPAARQRTPHRGQGMVREGAWDDYRVLSRFHYRAARPATVARVLVDAGARGEVRGVLVVSMPARFGPWRARAWPGEAHGVRQVNARLRTISRVVVAPCWRGLGVARGLVEAYLSAPLTDRTEAIAAMGAICPLFTAAGMRRVDWGPARRVVRLRERLRRLGIEPWRLADVGAVEAWARRCPGPGAELERALRIFARAHAHTRPAAAGPLRGLILLGARHAACDPAVFVHDREAGGRGVR